MKWIMKVKTKGTPRRAPRLKAGKASRLRIQGYMLKTHGRHKTKGVILWRAPRLKAGKASRLRIQGSMLKTHGRHKTKGVML